MNAYVIDQKQLKRYVLEIVVALVIAFSLGFALGLQQSSVNDDIKQAEQAKVLDKDSHAKMEESSDAEKKYLKGKAADKKTAESNEKVKTAAEAKQKIEQEKIQQEKLALKKLAEKKLAKQKLEKEKKAKQKLAREKLAKEKLAKEKLAREKIAKQKQAKAELDKKKLEAKPSAATSSSAIPPPVAVKSTASAKRVFSIQAGMFASKTNAESFIEKLEAKKFEAYVSDFESSGGTTKYNVRVGKFDDRGKARELLKEFQKSFSSPAYVVIAQ